MLDPSAMTRAVLAVILVAASSSVASAGGYIGLGIGTAPAVNSEVETLTQNGRSVRLLGGARFGRFSVEGAIHGHDTGRFAVKQASLAGKFNLPLGDQFEAFGRAGLGKAWFDYEPDAAYDVSGRVFLIGAGIEYRLDLGVAAGSIWIDYQYNSASLSGERSNFDIGTRMWTLGVTVGF